MTARIRILVADDHPVVRDGLAAMLATQPDFEVVAVTATGQEALARTADANPAIVVLDLEMPDLDGVETLGAFTESHPEVRVLVFTAFDDDDRIISAVRAGAKGYLLKGAPREQVFEAIRVIHGGGSLLEPVVASKLMRHLSDDLVRLTPRESEVLELLAEGRTNKEIADQLVISVRTAKFHVSSILRKLNAGNRTEAVRLAADHGLIKLHRSS